MLLVLVLLLVLLLVVLLVLVLLPVLVLLLVLPWPGVVAVSLSGFLRVLRQPALNYRAPLLRGDCVVRHRWSTRKKQAAARAGRRHDGGATVAAADEHAAGNKVETHFIRNYPARTPSPPLLLLPPEILRSG